MCFKKKALPSVDEQTIEYFVQHKQYLHWRYLAWHVSYLPDQKAWLFHDSRKRNPFPDEMLYTERDVIAELRRGTVGEVTQVREGK